MDIQQTMSSLQKALEDAIKPTHGRVNTPKSRASLLTERGLLGDRDGIDSGKGFPGTREGWLDPAGPGDVWAAAPPVDGKICSAEHSGERARLDDPTYDWAEEPVTSNSELTVTWDFSMKHKTRRFTYWLTKEGWDDSQPLAREHLDLENPVYEDIKRYVPYYGPDADEQLMVKDPTTHTFTLPQRTGHHILLGVWNVADTPAAFYMAIDLLFPDGGEKAVPSQEQSLMEPLLKRLLELLRAYQSSVEPLHGKVEFPPSRAYHLMRQGILTEHQANELEGGKGFPVMYGHWIDPDAPDDVPGREPPWDGEIASGGRVSDNRKYLNYANQEPFNEPGVNLDTNWPKYRVDRNVPFKISWHHAAAHKTRRWSYWLTQEGWDSTQRLRREHFGDEPVHVLTWHYQPYWGDKAEQELVPPMHMIHEFDLPERHGYHVLLAVWDVADTFSSFYQVIDLDFG